MSSKVITMREYQAKIDAKKNGKVIDVEMTRDEVFEALDKEGVEYKKNAKTADLQKLLG